MVKWGWTDLAHKIFKQYKVDFGCISPHQSWMMVSRNLANTCSEPLFGLVAYSWENLFLITDSSSFIMCCLGPINSKPKYFLCLA